MAERDLYGGWKGLRFEATGYFRLEEANGRWWFVTPKGHVFLSHGVNQVGDGLLKSPYFIQGDRRAGTLTWGFVFGAGNCV